MTPHSQFFKNIQCRIYWSKNKLFCSWSGSNNLTSACSSTRIRRLIFTNSSISAQYVFSVTVRWVKTFFFERFIFITFILIIVRIVLLFDYDRIVFIKFFFVRINICCKQRQNFTRIIRFVCLNYIQHLELGCATTVSETQKNICVYPNYTTVL